MVCLLKAKIYLPLCDGKQHKKASLQKSGNVKVKKQSGNAADGLGLGSTGMQPRKNIPTTIEIRGRWGYAIFCFKFWSHPSRQTQ